MPVLYGALRRALMVCFASMFITGSALAGSELLGLLQVLRDNGTITEAQFQQLAAAAATPDAPPSPAAPAHIADTEKPARQPERSSAAVTEKPAGQPEKSGVVTETDGGLKVESEDGRFGFEVEGQVWFDAAAYNSDVADLGSGTEMRRARVNLSGTLFDDWAFAAEYDFAGNEAEVKDAFIAYEGLDDVDLKLGQFKEPFSLEEQTSGRYLAFMERSLPVDSFSPGRSIGVGLSFDGRDWGAAAGLFGEGIGDDADDEGDEGWGASGRATYAFINESQRHAQLGASIAYRRPDDEGEIRYRSRPESAVTNVTLVDTGNIKDVDATRAFGLESLWMEGPAAFWGEYIRSDVERGDAGGDLSFDGWYVAGSWIITGESRKYDAKRGRFGRVRPDRALGAWELALRYSKVDLSDKDISGGQEANVTLGLNWYVNPQVRFMANYIWVDAAPSADGVSDSPSILQLRGQLDF